MRTISSFMIFELSAAVILLQLVFLCNFTRIVCTGSTTESDANVTLAEYTALYQFYNATHGQHWTWLNFSISGVPWDFGPNARPCTSNDSFAWAGIRCSFEAPYEYYYITQIDLPSHNLTGTIPNSITAFTRLKSLTISGNNLYGSIPSIWENLLELEILDLSNNTITGPIPPFLRNINNLKQLALGINHLTGTIPDFIGNLTELELLDIGTNLLTGGIPDILGRLTRLKSFYIDANSFTGTFPSFINNFRALEILDLNDNLLSGPIPEFLYGIEHIRYVDMSGNGFTGTISNTLGNASAIAIFFVNKNRFTGTIPDSLGNLSRLLYTDFGKNSFTGSIPNTLGRLLRCQFLHFHNNLLTGTLPANIGNLRRVQEFYPYSNFIVGTIPVSYSNMSSLTSLLLDNNVLTGPVQNCWNSSNQPFLNTVILTNNQLTGKLPEDVFRIQALHTFQAAENCFEGSLPEVICNATGLRYVVLDGLRSASSCQFKVFPSLSNVYLNLNPITNGIPPCIFQLPNLNALHISGNGLTGSLPQDESLFSQKIIDLSLSHNQLTGTIPYHIQERSWHNLDLSYNRIGGTVLASFGTIPVVNFVRISYALGYTVNLTYEDPRSALKLGNNRLSGMIPDTWMPIQNISVLKGNLFSCRYDHSNLPKYDDEKDNYQCGSNLFQLPYYAWLVILGCILLGFLTVYCWREEADNIAWLATAKSTLRRWYFVARGWDLAARVSTYNYVTTILEVVLSIALWSTVYAIFVLTPAYLLLSRFGYATHTHEYAWTVSAAFMSGVLPFGVLFALFTLLMMLVLRSFVLSVSENYRDWRQALKTQKRKRIISTSSTRQPSPTAATAGHSTGISNVTLSPLAPTLPEHDDPYSQTAALAAALAAAGVENREDSEASRLHSTFTNPSGAILTESPDRTVSVDSTISDRIFSANGAADADFDELTQQSDSDLAPWWEKCCLYGALMTTNFTIVLGANILFVYIALRESSLIVTLAQVLLSLFKFLWHRFGMRHLIHCTQDYIQRSPKVFYRTEFFLIQLFSTLVNNIGIPCLVVASINPSCMYNFFVSPSNVESYYSSNECDNKQEDFCSHYVPTIHSISYDPPFSYSYQCSSSFITYYAPAFVNLAILAGFVSPLSQLIALRMYQVAEPGTQWYALLNAVVPKILKLPPESECVAESSSTGNCSATHPLGGRKSDIEFGAQGSMHSIVHNLAIEPSDLASMGDAAEHVGSNDTRDCDSLESQPPPAFVQESTIRTSSTREEKEQQQHKQQLQQVRDQQENELMDIYQAYFDANQLFLTMLMYLALLLTFGVVFPPLAGCLVVAIVVVYWFSRVKVGRFLAVVLERKLFIYARVIDRECKGIGSLPILQRSVWLIIWFCFAFYTLFLFDMLGDAEGFRKSYWVLLVTPIMPIFILPVHIAHTSEAVQSYLRTVNSTIYPFFSNLSPSPPAHVVASRRERAAKGDDHGTADTDKKTQTSLEMTSLS